MKFTFIIDFPIKELPSIYGVGQLESKQPATILLDKGVRGWILELAEWLKLRGEILERIEPHREATCKSAYTSKLSCCLG